MWLAPPFRRMFVASQCADLRRSFDGLGAIVEGFDCGGAMSGDLFVFFNARRTQVRMLFWNATGYCKFMKRLEAGTFRRVTSGDNSHFKISSAELTLLFEGVDATALRRRKRFKKN